MEKVIIIIVAIMFALFYFICLIDGSFKEFLKEKLSGISYSPKSKMFVMIGLFEMIFLLFAIFLSGKFASLFIFLMVFEVIVGWTADIDVMLKNNFYKFYLTICAVLYLITSLLMIYGEVSQ